MPKSSDLPLTVTQYAALHKMARQRVLQLIEIGRFGDQAKKTGPIWLIYTADDVRKTRGTK